MCTCICVCGRVSVFVFVCVIDRLHCKAAQFIVDTVPYCLREQILQCSSAMCSLPVVPQHRSK